MAKRVRTMFDAIGGVPFGRLSEVIAVLKSPERTAYRPYTAGFSDKYTFQEWPNRPSMARSIRMQESREHKPTDWKPVIKLEPTEGY
jgi:hypothetical protein